MSSVKWRCRRVLVVPALVGAAVAAWVWSDAFDRLAAAARAVSIHAGLTVNEVWVEGHSRTDRSALIRVLAVPVGEPSLFVDLHVVLAKVRELGWVADAQARIRLPGRLQVSLQERTPAALWQTGGMLYAIESSGHVIEPVAFRDFPDLLLVVGDGANAKLEDLAQLFAAQPRVAEHVDAAIRVSGRRWTLRTDTGLIVHLPEADPAATLAKLEGHVGGLAALGPSIEAVDLRVPGRIVVRKRAAPEAPRLRDGV
ncbi:MAG: cell division protein FtsQ/DivIB [Alphaproteobacteria bacterium]|nr:cell division protein FtsQ/DivIB [Alphaproteobacteria bacterium]